MNYDGKIVHGHHCCPDYIFKSIFFNGNIQISIQISLKFVPTGSVNNKLAFVQLMTWHQTNNKPLSIPIMASLTDAYTLSLVLKALGGDHYFTVL